LRQIKTGKRWLRKVADEKRQPKLSFGACRPWPANGELLGGGGLDFSVGLGLDFCRLGGGDGFIGVRFHFFLGDLGVGFHGSLGGFRIGFGIGFIGLGFRFQFVFRIGADDFVMGLALVLFAL